MKKLLIVLVFVIVVLFGFVQRASAQENAGSEEIDIMEFVENLDRDSLEELTLELLADSLGASVYEMLDDSKDAMAIVKRVRMSGNDDLAKSTLRTLSVAAETFATVDGKYPQKTEDLTEDDEPYLSQGYCGETIAGYKYDCDFSSEGYRFVATPVMIGDAGTKTFIITTGGVFSF